MGKNAVGGKKHPIKHKEIRNDERPNGKKWKKGLHPDKRKKS